MTVTFCQYLKWSSQYTANLLAQNGRKRSDKIIQRGLWMWYKISLAWNYHPVFDTQWGSRLYIEGVCWVALNMNGRYPFRFAMKSIDVAWLQLHHNTFSSKIPPVLYFRDRAMWSMSIWAIRRNVIKVIAGRSVNMPPITPWFIYSLIYSLCKHDGYSQICSAHMHTIKNLSTTWLMAWLLGAIFWSTEIYECGANCSARSI